MYIPRDFLFLYQYRILKKFKSILILNQFYTRYLCNVEKIVTCCHCLIRKRNDGGWWSVCIELIFPNINDVYIEVDWRTLSSLKSIPNTVDFSREEGFWIVWRSFCGFLSKMSKQKDTHSYDNCLDNIDIILCRPTIDLNPVSFGKTPSFSIYSFET